MRLNRIDEGLIFEDIFTSLNPRWLIPSPTAVNVTERPGAMRVNHSNLIDITALFDMVADSLVFEVVADYTPTVDGDEAGVVIWRNSTDFIELVESVDTAAVSKYVSFKVKKNQYNYDFFAQRDGLWELIDTTQMTGASKAGFIAKQFTSTGSVPFDVTSIVVCKSDYITIGNAADGNRVELYDSSNNLISSSIVTSSGGNKAILVLPSLKFVGYVRMVTPLDVEVDRTDGTFYGGDEYTYGSYLELLEGGVTIPINIENEFGEMVNGVVSHKYRLVNGTQLNATGLTVTVQKHALMFGNEWTAIAKDVAGVPDVFGTVLTYPALNSGEYVEFWVRVQREITIPYEGFDPLYFDIIVEHS